MDAKSDADGVEDDAASGDDAGVEPGEDQEEGEEEEEDIVANCTWLVFGWCFFIDFLGLFDDIWGVRGRLSRADLGDSQGPGPELKIYIVKSIQKPATCTAQLRTSAQSRNRRHEG